jgi:tetratricopeptide (TPR) repeat protein/transglutaminase-like putative cysteine protease
MRQFLVFSLSLGLIGSLAAQSTPAPSSGKQAASSDNSKEALITERMDVRVRYENDGTGSTEVSTSIRVVSEAGVEALGQLVFGYSSGTEKLDVNYVRVKKPGGEIIETPPTNAQDFAPEVLRSTPMYSDYRQRHVTVSGLRPGDLLEYRITRQFVTPLIPGEFWFEYSFPRDVTVNEALLEIDVPKSREVKLKSPKRQYTTTDNGDQRIYRWVVENIAPDRSDKGESSQEVDLTTDERDEQPEIQLTTFKNWQEIATWYAKLQSQQVVVDDSIRKKAAELTRGAATPEEKAQRLYDFVAKDIRYVSLSFGIGRYQPHPATDVLQGSYGDCKDKHTLLAALLQAVGIQSYPVLIGSDHKLDEEVPSPGQFDHVITAAQIGKNLVWLDATEEVAPYGMIMYPLRDKQAVLASADANGGLRKTPANSPVKNSLLFVLDGKLTESGGVDAGIEITAQGDSALFLRIGLRRIPEADWKKMAEYFAGTAGLRGDVSDVSVGALDDLAQPLQFKFKIHQDSLFKVPSFSEPFFLFPPLDFGRLRKTKSDEPVDIGPLMEEHQKVHLQFPANYTLVLPPEVKFSRDYAEYSSVYRFANDVLDGERNLVIKVNKLPATRRTEVESLSTVVLDRVSQSVACTIRSVANTTKTASAVPGGSTQELHKAGVKALDDRDFKTASELLQRVVEQEPKSKDAWDELGLAYRGLNNHPQALNAFQKQVEVNQFHKRAYDDLAAELRNEGKFEDAVAAYSKQLDNLPVDRQARRNRGMLLLQLKRDKEALADLEAVVAVPPEDPEIDLALAQLYLVGSPDKARSLFLNVIGSTAPVSNGDIYDSALQDNVHPEEAVRDATQIVNGIGDQFDEGVYDTETPETFTAMHFVALEWARIGWATFLKGQTLEGMRFLNSAWTLSQSGTVANHLGRLYLKAGQTDKAKHSFALAIAAGGAEVQDSRAQLKKLSGAQAEAEITQATSELLQMRSVKVPGVSAKTGAAEFTLVFDGSSKPQLVVYHSGDAGLADSIQALMDVTYPVIFPDVSSVKIVRRGVLTCSASDCALALKPLEAVTAVPGVSNRN